MAETLTANYGWTKPDPGASANTWGATLNADLDKIDAQVFANQQAGVPIGSGALWYSATPPANWLLCLGQALSTSAPYDKLFAVLGYAYGGSGGSFNLPNFQNIFPVGAGPGGALAATGGTTTVILDATMIPAHTHPITDVAHTHTVTPTPHTHPDPGHTHGGTTASQTPHSHGPSNLMEFVGSGGTLGVGASPNNVNTTAVDTQQPAVSVTVAPAATNLQPATATVTLAAADTGITTTGSIGGGLAHENRPPFLVVNFIIKFA